MATESPLTISLERLRLFDACCDDFEAAFATGQEPDLRQYLLPIEHPDQRRRLLQLLLSLEIDLRLRRNESLSSQRYAERFPEYQDIVQVEFLRAGLPCGQDEQLPLDGSAFMERLVELGIVPAVATDEILSQNTLARDDEDSASTMARLCAQNYLTAFQCCRLGRGSFASLRIGQYVLLDELGRGGMGHVFRARHVVMQREVAIKRLLPRFAVTQAAEARFQREVQLLGQLSHPQIVAAYDAGMDAGMLYLVMELVQGQNLRDRVRRSGPLPVVDAIEIARCAASGLAYAHSCSVVHRDIKPSNLMVTDDGMLKVLDLGLANVLLDDEPVRAPRSDGETVSTEAALEDLTGSRFFLGTPGFAPPEQVVSPRGVDGRADVYSLGMTLRFLLSGRGPGAANSTDHSGDSNDAVRGDVPVELETLIGQMTEYARDRRPAMAVVEQRMAQILSASRRASHCVVLNQARSEADPDALQAQEAEPELVLRQVRPVPARRFALAGSAILALAAVCLALWGSGLWGSGFWAGKPVADAGFTPALPHDVPELPTAPPPYWDAPAAMLYVSQERNPPAVYRLRPDGTGLETLYAAEPSDGVYIRGMAADLINGWLYVNGCPRIFRMRFDGTQREVISAPASLGPGDAMTLLGSHLFFTDGLTAMRCFSISSESLQLPVAERRSRTLVDVFSSQYRPLNSLAWDVVGQQFYWDADDVDGNLWLVRWRGEGARPQKVTRLSAGTRDLQCDYRQRILYWCSATDILQLDLKQASPSPQLLVSPASKEISHFAFDFARRRLYWTEVITGRVGEYNLEDGSSRLLLNDPDRFDHLREVLVIPEVPRAAEKTKERP